MMQAQGQPRQFSEGLPQNEKESLRCNSVVECLPVIYKVPPTSVLIPANKHKSPTILKLEFPDTSFLILPLMLLVYPEVSSTSQSEVFVCLFVCLFLRQGFSV